MKNFENEAVRLGKSDKYLLDIADEVVSGTVQELAEQSKQFCDTRQIPIPDSDSSDDVCKKIKFVFPAEEVPSLADLINGGWKAYLDDTLWAEHSDLQSV